MENGGRRQSFWTDLCRPSLFLCAFFLLTSCSSPSSSPSSTSSNSNQTLVTISLGQVSAAGALYQKGVIPPGIQSMEVTAVDVNGAPVAQPVIGNAPNLTVSLNVPNGPKVVFNVLAFSGLNATGNRLFEGSSAAYVLSGTPITVSVKMNLSVIVSGTLISSDPYTGIAVFDLYGLVAGAAPPATSPLLWSLPAGQGTLGMPTANGATVRWTSPQKAGVYTVTATVDTTVNPDQAPGISDVARITVKDGIKPIITMLGITPYTMSQGHTYADAGATAWDNFDGDLSNSIAATSTVNTLVPGTYTVTYNVGDLGGNKAVPVIRTVIVQDTTAPVITLNGVSPLSIEAGTIYVDALATVTDNVDATNTKLAGISTVNTALPGTYSVTYNASDAAGNAAVQIVRTVNVVDTTAPVITPPANIVVAAVDAYGTPASDPNIVAFLAGATATDNVALIGGVTNNAPAQFPLGITTVTFSASDAIPNSSSITATVSVLDQTAPIITLNGIDPYVISAGQVYVDAYATVTDNVDATITQLAGVSNVNAAVPGTYTVIYNAKDAAGNAAAQVVRTVVVGDTTPPVITLNGVTPVTVEAGSTYVDAYATLTDNLDPTNTQLVGVSTVNTAVPGVYTVTYNASDVSGNVAIPVVRTINVVDTTAPVITPPANITVAAIDAYGTPASDPYIAAFLAGATATDNVAVIGGVTNNAPMQFPLGITPVTFSSYDAVPNIGTATASLSVVDLTAPVIQINGANPYTMHAGSTFIDPGYSATDDVDGNLTAQVVVINSVQANTPGTYSISYDVQDAALNSATTVVRSVQVINQAPQIINPANPYAFSVVQDTYSGFAVTAVDPDFDTVTFDLAVPPVNGSASIDIYSGVMSYIGAANFTGSDSMTLRASDAFGGSALLDVYVTVTPRLAAFTATGVVAAGAPVAASTILMSDRYGAMATIVTDAYGRYSISNALIPPVLMQVDRYGLPSLFTIGTLADGYAHITPLTTLAAAKVLGASNSNAIITNFPLIGSLVTYADMYTAISQITSALGLNTLTQLSQINPLDDPLFAADGTKLDAVLDGLNLVERNEDADFTPDMVLSSRTPAATSVLSLLSATGLLTAGQGALAVSGATQIGDDVGGIIIGESDIVLLSPVPDLLTLAQLPVTTLAYNPVQLNQVLPIAVEAAVEQGVNLADVYARAGLTSYLDQLLVKLQPSLNPTITYDHAWGDQVGAEVVQMSTVQLDIYGSFTPLFIANIEANRSAFNLTAPIQQIILTTNAPATLPILQGSAVTVSIAYSTSDNAQTTGLGLAVFFDSTRLTYVSAQPLLATSQVVAATTVQTDTLDRDNDPATNSYVVIGWADITAAWPGTAFPLNLATLNFTSLTGLQAAVSTPVNVLSTSRAATHRFQASSIAIGVTP